MNRSARYVVAAIGFACVAVLIYVLLHNRGSGTPLQGKASVRLAWLPGATFAGDYAAIDQGYWKKRGLDVTISPGGFEYDAIKLVASGTDDFGISSGPQILQARANGVPVVAIGAVIPRSPIGWVSKKNSGITSPQGFVGRKIGAQFGTHTEITLEALCAKLGIDTKSFERIPVRFDPKPFVADQIDVLPVYIIDQPFDLAAAGVEVNVIDPGDYGVSLAFGNVYFTTENVIRSKPDMVRRFLAGAKEGWVWTNDNRDKAVDILAKAAPDADKSVMRRKLGASLNFIMKGRTHYDGVFAMSLDDWTSTKDVLVKYGELKPDVDPSKCFTDEFVPK